MCDECREEGEYADMVRDELSDLRERVLVLRNKYVKRKDHMMNQPMGCEEFQEYESSVQFIRELEEVLKDA